MIIDSSAWIEYLRTTRSPASMAVRRLIGAVDLHITEVVLMEVLAGGTSERQTSQLRRLLLGHCTVEPTLPQDFEEAALLHRQCRRAGETVRQLTDCLIAAVAIRTGLEVLSPDKDFSVLARHTQLRLHSMSR